ncbi:Crp/Fnr family transcriptional regulator [Anaeromyxobacter dehalogenans]|uniref:Cyclic nucleotide-binding domain (CNMP-BD) protein n=1 Tax=Anaeromyxobacter dehalogenans (strain 2CP-C) TaxID=290397 RepID=Q2IQF1_ANADE|nr:Crp/Fnr family transcriptional regulator [Anaeromyxobacter dehalogenans]ABC81030.1 cyclic nucleotide-binding domain (cNMP-BD) protein [Anaeromyxobacter dehalogenans 2CP-C]
MPDDQLLQRFGREFPRGAVLFREGEPGREMFVVQQGRVTLSKRVGDLEKILASMGPGEFLGEMSILNNRPRSATATCAEDARLLVIDALTFEAMVRGNAEIAIRMVKKLADRLQEAEEQIENLLFHDASSRVVHFLVTAADKASRGPAGHEIEVAPRELAGRVGVRPEEADEALAKLVKAKIVAVRPDGFLVPDVSKLRHFLEFLQVKAQFGGIA